MSCLSSISQSTPATGNVIEDNCAGRNPQIQGQTWFNYFQTQQCSQVFQNILFTTDSGLVGYNPNKAPQISSDMTNIISTYLTTNQFVLPGQLGYNDFQNQIIDTCTLLPGTCDTALSGVCQNCNREQIASNPLSLQLCGCRAPTENEIPNLPTYCDPLCTRVGTIPLGNPVTGNALECNAPVCVIDTVSIQATESSIGSVQFNQVCNVCSVQGSTGCRCIISGVSLSQILTDVGVGAQFNQLCGSNSVCLQIDPQTQIATSVDCQSILPSTPKVPINFPWWILIFAGFLIGLTILVIFAARQEK